MPFAVFAHALYTYNLGRCRVTNPSGLFLPLSRALPKKAIGKGNYLILWGIVSLLQKEKRICFCPWRLLADA